MNTSRSSLALTILVLAFVTVGFQNDGPTPADPVPAPGPLVHYLEVVSADVDETCRVLEEVHGVNFGEPVLTLGNARTASLAGGGTIGVRAPMSEQEQPVVRPYVLVDDLRAAVAAVEAAGAEIALPYMELAGHGKIAIYLVGGIQHGLWEL